ncbi:E3 ubiquitin-protein ligase Topors-like [Pipra filicauda]|uniref:E3 ubiquitin-protein ligase Topors-like n=1 Tax=Pipra filicauda TaxID=649802 RepID=A0A6J2GWK7_9PASS|nr:E3 ubiquitin-protein ligase Topors-like [Pipra filicauda]XP_027579692.2 E3 ubiquitin-protein ligase Topors-like [Pipra filicauda]XP_039239746.1 E3 ubiquitin-protein ligase Topors-like [Pipra filicauda]XP_039239747.1 E3 ubiquitin-protein ligase Topors-like [Pipra filicauda]XP_039239748.1 E3 ubiquitin-protein ligase Topors-like [Pipra filicauda]XP_039239749.1 E3 ubiquitin-protein ligase Topors-like [Pipra filicauda]
MAMEIERNCSICQDTQKDVASALPCHHRFCLGCILRWAQRNPSCPLCRRTIETIRFSDSEDDYLETAITAPEELPDSSSLAGIVPDVLDENSPHFPVASHPSSPQGTLSPPEKRASGLEFGGGLLPEVWAGLFRGRQQLLDPVRPWLRQRLEGIYRGWWWLVEAAESTILHDLCVKGPNAQALIEGLEPLLEQHTALLVHGAINIIVGQCSEEAQRLLQSGAVRDENNSPVARASSSSNSSWEGSSASGPAGPNVETEADTSKATLHRGPRHPPPVPVPAEQDQPQEELGQAMTVAGSSAQGSSCGQSNLVLGRHQCPDGPGRPPDRRAPSPRTLPSPARDHPSGSTSRAPATLCSRKRK